MTADFTMADALRRDLPVTALMRQDPLIVDPEVGASGCG